MGPKGSWKRQEAPIMQFIRAFTCKVKLQRALGGFKEPFEKSKMYSLYVFLRVKAWFYVHLYKYGPKGILEASRSPKYAVYACFYVQNEAPTGLLEAPRHHLRGPEYAVFTCFYV